MWTGVEPVKPSIYYIWSASLLPNVVEIPGLYEGEELGSDDRQIDG